MLDIGGRSDYDALSQMIPEPWGWVHIILTTTGLMFFLSQPRFGDLTRVGWSENMNLPIAQECGESRL